MAMSQQSIRQRRKWQLQEGCRAPLHRLRSQLAEDGCSNSQLILAKNLLQESESCIGTLDNAELAIHWLIQSSDQANPDATKLLKNCFRIGKGITDRNCRNVEDCLNRSFEEKEYRKAAHDLFTMLTSSSGNDYITLHQLKLESLKLCRGMPLDGNVENNHFHHPDQDDYGYTLKDLQKVASAIYIGQEPKLSLKQDPQVTADQPSIQSFPFKVISSFYDRLLDFSTKQGQYVFVRWFLPTNQFHVVALVLLYSVLTTKLILKLLPILICYISMLVMVTSTLQILRYQIGLVNFKLWSTVFNYFNPKVRQLNVESKYNWNNISPYIQFLVSSIVNVLVLPSTSAPWIPYSEFTIISVIMAVCIYARLSNNKNTIILNISTLCCMMSSVPQMLRYANPPSYIKSLVSQVYFRSIYLGYGVELNISIFSISYLTLICICARMVWKERSSSVYEVLLPQLTFFMWWQIAVRYFNFAHVYVIMKTIFTWSIFSVVFYILGWFLSLLVIVGFFTLIVLTKQSYFKFFITLLLILCPMFISWWTEFRKSNRYLNFAQKYNYIFILLAVGSIISPIFSNIGISYPKHDVEAGYVAPSTMKWDDYYEKCHKPAWQSSSMAYSEMKCSALTHAVVDWEGVVNLVRVISIENPLDQLFMSLPGEIGSWLQCLYGQEFAHDEDIQQLYQNSNLQCHLQVWNKYSYEVVLRMKAQNSEAPVDIFVDVDSDFKQHAVGLRRGDAIRIKGSLESDIGGSRPHLTLIESQCIQCSNKSLGLFKTRPIAVNISDKILAAAQSCFSFFFSPLLNYHPANPSL